MPGFSETVSDEKAIVERAEFQLHNLGLSWADIRGKTVLDLGAGDAFLNSAVSIKKEDTKVYSLDLKFPSGVTTPQKFVVADAIEPPFPDEAFDLILAHASGTEIFKEGPYKLKVGGELRQYPLYGYADHCMFYYLVHHKGYSEEDAGERIRELYKMNEEYEYADYGPCKEWCDLENEAIDGLSHEEKLSIVGPLVERWSKVTELALEYEIVGWAHNQPTVVLIYRKKL